MATTACIPNISIQFVNKGPKYYGIQTHRRVIATLKHLRLLRNVFKNACKLDTRNKPKLYRISSVKSMHKYYSIADIDMQRIVY